MAQLNVQPKKKGRAIWIVLAIIILAILLFFLRGCYSPGISTDHPAVHSKL